MAHKLDTCKKCPAMIFWGKSPRGANMPYDAVPVTRDDDPRVTARAVLYYVDEEGQGVAVDRFEPIRYPVYLSHFVTCTAPNEFSGSRRR